MYLLDTNICIYGVKNSCPALTKRLLTIPPDEVFVSTITIGELEYGCSKSQWSERSRNVMSMFLAPFSVLSFSREDAILFGKLRAELAKAGTPIGPYDIQIAAQGVSRGLTVVTHNTGEFIRVPGLKIEDWTI